MPNPGSFRGSRKDFLLGEKEAYSQAVSGNYTSEALATIYRRYFKRYPVDLSHHTEPNAEHLAAVNDNEPDPEITEPDIFALSQEEYAAEMEVLNRRKDTIEFRKSQIKRWMAYQYMKDHHIDPKETGADNPYRLLLCKLTGRTLERPRRKTPVNVWRKTQRAAIEYEVRQRHGHDIPKAQLATLRDRVARDMFGRLDERSRREWELLAQEEHTVAIEQWTRDMEAPPSTNPVDRQRSIQGLVGFVQPILDMICDVTGWKASLIAGGPEPAQDGQLNVISIHSGTTSGEVKMTFGHAERANIKKTLVPMFGAFLQKCYTPVECRSRALSAKDGHVRLSDMDLDSQNISIHSVGQRRNGPPPITVAPIVAGSARPPIGPKALTPAVRVNAAAKPALDPKAPVAVASTAAIVHQARVVPSAPAPDAPVAATAPVAVPDAGALAVGNISAVPATDSNDGNSPGAEVFGCLTEQEYILLREADTLQKMTSAPEDEIDMTLSRSVSPFSTNISPVPSPLPSRCPSPIIASPAANSTPPDAEGAPAADPISACANDVVDTTACTVATGPSVLDPSSATLSKRKKGAKALTFLPAASPKDPSVPIPSPGRPRRKVTKTSKLLLMEEASSRKGRKRGAGMLEGNPTVDQAPAKRRRVGKARM